MKKPLPLPPKRLAAFLFLMLLIGGTWFILSNKRFHTSEGKIFGTTYHIKYSSSQSLDREIAASLQEVDDALSMFNDSSTLSRFNRGEEYPYDACFDEVVSHGLEVSRDTHGAFDMTVAPLVNLWGFGFKHRENVTPQMVDSLMQFVGYQLLSYGKPWGGLHRRNPATTIDCGAIAKGYGADHVAKMLAQKGCRNFMVEIGGEVVVRGQNPEGRKWSVGITKPTDDSTGVQNELQDIIRITDCAVATSGNYRNFYYNGEKKISHTIDPTTGYPVSHSLLSATVIASSCMTADAYATSFMVMGLERTKEFLKQHQHLKVYLIYSDSKGNLKTWKSDNFATTEESATR